MPRRPQRFDASSLDATLARLIERVDAQGKTMTEKLDAYALAQAARDNAMLAEAKKTNGRVGTLEDWKAGIKGWLAGVVAASGVIGTIAGFVLQLWLK